MDKYRGNVEAIKALVRETEVHRDVYIDDEVFALALAVVGLAKARRAFAYRVERERQRLRNYKPQYYAGSPLYRRQRDPEDD